MILVNHSNSATLHPKARNDMAPFETYNSSIADNLQAHQIKGDMSSDQN